MKPINKYSREQKESFLIDVLGYSEFDCTTVQLSYIDEVIQENLEDFYEYMGETPILDIEVTL